MQSVRSGCQLFLLLWLLLLLSGCHCHASSVCFLSLLMSQLQETILHYLQSRCSQKAVPTLLMIIYSIYKYLNVYIPEYTQVRLDLHGQRDENVMNFCQLAKND